ncbi:hypothetical protein GOP47_0020342 [Adiantum capillus-veneris]|uniref:DUF1421 domain-containing protein n=1 Tax=Adiantum capillus-veneris TaxID=13818 RepID=A0A9D4Z9G9_ADICA|nr:hypothetical protein GOP47_0020342 [Adiantum capillus-veneris]
MDLLSKDEPLINLNGFDSTEEGDDLLSEEFQPHHQRRISSSKHASLSSRQHRLPSGSKVYLRELSPVRKDQSMERNNSAIVSAVERTMKNYADGVLHVLEGMSGRLSQLESISQDLEHSVTTLTTSVEENHEHTDRNFKILNERIMEMHRSVQILRDKQDIIEAHAQLEKLQTSKALAEKQSLPGLAITDSQETGKGYQQQGLQVQSQKSLPQPHVSQPLALAPPPLVSQPPPSLAPQPPVSQPQSLGTPQYQALNSQSQQLVPVQHVPHQEASGQVIQQISKAPMTPSEQVQYQSVPQQLQVQPMLPSLPPPMLQTQQPLEQGRYQSVPSQMQMQQPPLQQGSSQLPMQVTTPQQTEQAHYQSAPQQRQLQVPQSQASVQQPLQPQQQGMMTQQPIQGQQGIVTQQPIQAHQGVVPQQPQHLQQQPSSRVQGSFQYYGQPNDGQSYATIAPGTPTYTQGGYITESARDAANFVPQQRPLPPNPSQHSSQLPPVQSFHQMALTPPQVPQPLQESGSFGNVSGPMTWNRQTNLGAPNAAPRLPTAQPLRGDHPSPEGSGIVDKVVAMGFSRDQVHGVIRRLAERNQSVDMNVVLDILMNGGGRGIQGGFGR